MFHPYRLADGTQVLLRPIRSDDKRILGAAFAQLSPESARLRFLGAKSRLTSAELRYLTEVDGVDHVALIAVEAANPSHVVGVARFIRDVERPDTAEFAIVVGDPYQGHGAGRALARMLVNEARLRGIRRFTATTLAENAPVQRLIASIALDLEHVITGAGTRFIEAELAA